jgi:hypothetical protein
MPLPLHADPAQFRRIVTQVRRCPNGILLKRIKHHGFLPYRNLEALVRWRVIKQEGGIITLDALGQSLAARVISRQELGFQILCRESAYRSVLEWIGLEDKDSVSSADVAAFWLEHHPDATGNVSQETRWAQARCFFRFCEAMGLGKLKVGYRPHPTRFLVNRISLWAFLDAYPAAGHAAPRSIFNTNPVSERVRRRWRMLQREAAQGAESSPEADPTKSLRVVVAYRKKAVLANQVHAHLMSAAGIDCEIAESDERTAVPVPGMVQNAMRRCTASVVIVSREDALDQSSWVPIHQDLLNVIAASYVLFEGRVVLLWQNRVPIPTYLRGLHRCEFDGNGLSPMAAIELADVLVDVLGGTRQDRGASIWSLASFGEVS